MQARQPALQSLGGLLGLVAVGLPFTGAGPLNGDQAVYLDQVARGAWFERWTHVGYVLLHAGWGSSWRSDVLSLFVGSLGLVGVARLVGARAALALALMVLPALPFGEVDVYWFTGLVAAALTGPVLGGLLLAVAVSFSPTVLATVPWLMVRFKDRRWLGALGMVALLTLLSRGGWWMGNRGVLVSAWSLAPWLHVAPAVLMAVLLGRRPSWIELLALGPLLLAPSDIPAAWALSLAVILGRERLQLKPWMQLSGWLLAVALAVSGLFVTHARVVSENRRVLELAEQVGPADQVVGSWSWRVRVSLASTGKVDGFQGTGGRLIELPSGRVKKR